MDVIHSFTNDMVQFGLLLVGLITFYFMLKRDNRKANEEVFSKKLADVEKYNDLEKRVKLLEQRVDIYDDVIRKELEDIKKILNDLHEKFHNHLTTNHK
jgi:hypothetical protein